MIELPGTRWAVPPGLQGRPPWAPEVTVFMLIYFSFFQCMLHLSDSSVINVRGVKNMTLMLVMSKSWTKLALC